MGGESPRLLQAAKGATEATASCAGAEGEPPANRDLLGGRGGLEFAEGEGPRADDAAEDEDQLEA